MDRMELMRERWASFVSWRDDVVRELVALPDTLQQLREGVANFQVVGRRLAAATDGLEKMNDLSDSLASAVEDFNRTVGALIELNPFLRPLRRS